MSTSLKNLVALVKDRIAIEDEIEPALNLSLRAFNMVPCVTYFTFDDEENIDQLSDILVTYACYVILTKKAAMAITESSFSDLITLARELWNNWDSQVNNLKQSDSFYDDFVQE
jgi:hypothetical protein